MRFTSRKKFIAKNLLITLLKAKCSSYKNTHIAIELSLTITTIATHVYASNTTVFKRFPVD